MNSHIHKILLAALAASTIALGAQADRTPDKVQLWDDGPFWATMNIGADEPWESGLYFWWGDTIGYWYENGAWVASDGSTANFSFRSGNMPTSGKDNAALQSEGWITEDGVLAPAHDAAQAHWGGSWRMPTSLELSNLISNCDWTWTTTNSMNGYIVCGKGGYSSNSIFIPAAGLGGLSSATSFSRVGSYGYCWASAPSSGDAWSLDFSSSYHDTFAEARHYGFSVRPVYVPASIPVLVKEGLVAYYPFDGDTLDASGNGCNLSSTTKVWTTDRNGNENAALLFDGSLDRNLAANPFFGATNNLTIAMWAKPGGTVPTGACEATSGTGASFMYNTSATTIALNPSQGMYTSCVGVGILIGRNGIAVLNHRVNNIFASLVHYEDFGEDWIHVAIRISGNGAPELYVNGEYIKSGLQPAYTQFIGPSGDPNCQSTMGHSYVGALDEVRFYNRALDADEIELLAKPWDGEGDGTEASPYVVTSKEELETVIAFGKSLFVKLAPGTVIEGPVAIPDDLSALSLDLNGGSVVGTDGQPAIMLLGDTAFTASGSSGTISADEGVESVKRPGSVSVAAGSGIEMTGMNSVSTSVIVPKFVDGGAAEATAFEPSEGGTWTLEAYGELANDALGRDVSDGMVHVYASDTVEGLATARPMEGGVEIKDRKSAVKVTLEVTPPTASETQFFRVEFGD